MENQKSGHEETVGSENSLPNNPEESSNNKTQSEAKPRFFMNSLLDLPKKYVALVLCFGLVLVAGIYFYTAQNNHIAVKQFTNVYSFVPEKISKSATIQVNVPEGVDEETARNSIIFNPEVAGAWQAEEIAGVVIFKPKKPLKSGVYYAVNMDTGTVQMSGDFYVDEDPRVEAIFPGSGSESPEDSEITIVFNRPMVSLTTLTEQEKNELPITITPETSGRFKWISTRNLQFIPDTTLIPSSAYKVEVKSGLYSIDGLAVESFTHEFVTRPLRYEYISSDLISYKSPIIIDFNQPVDLDKTKKQISVFRNDGKNVSIEVEYGEITYFDNQSQKYITEADSSRLFVYQKKDAHSRNRLWDFDTSYNVSIKGATPLQGTINLTEENNSYVMVPNVVEYTKADSERSSLVRPDLLDVEGTLTVGFYDDVDIKRSDIAMKGLKEIVYGERCKTDSEGFEIYVGSSCELEEDKKTLIFSFKSDEFITDESFNLELKKIRTSDGFQVNTEPINIPLKTYPVFKIAGTVPKNQSPKATLDGMYVCTNVPLKEPGENGLSSYVKTEGYIVTGRWSPSRFVEQFSLYNYCPVGEFETNLRYGLLPETDYSLNLTLTDEFGQTATTELSFKTDKAKEKYTRFHNMQKQYNVTPSDRTNLTYAVENLEYVDMHICRLEPETFLERIADQAGSFEAPVSAGCTEVINEKISLPLKYWVNNYFQINLADYFSDTRGHYIVTFSNPLYKDIYENRQLFDRTYISVTNLAVGKKEIKYSDDSWSYSINPAKNKILTRTLENSTNLYWINNSKTLAPIIGASVVQYEGGYQKNFTRRASAFTNGEGIARVDVQKSLIGAVVRFGGDTAVISDWADTLMEYGSARDATRTYVYTDRPIYRPGHTVFVRGIDRIGFDGDYEIFNENEVKLEIFDSLGNSVYETSLAISDYGTFDTKFEIPDDAPLGYYIIEVFGQTFGFDVEEYVPASFKLEAELDKEEYMNGDNMKLQVQADYYFGVPLKEGTVSYSVTAQDYYFDRYTDDYFNFGGGWYNCYSCGYGDDFLFRGETTINTNGGAVIERELNFNDFFDDADSEGSKLVAVSITAKDINGRSVSMQKSFIIHKGDFYIEAKTDEYYTSVNTPIKLLVKTVDTKGEPIALKDITRNVYKVNWETFKRQEVDGGFYYRSEKKLEEISSETISTNSSGDYSGPLVLAKEGEYEIHVSKDGGHGSLIKTISNVYIYGSESISIPLNNNYELDLVVENNSLEVGDEATVLIKSPYDNAKVLITVERGTIYEYWIADVKGGLYLHKFPIKEEYTPNIFVSALLLSGNPEIKYGTARFEIGNDKNELNVKVSANKTNYLPGEEVTLTVETRDHTNKLVPAEVSLAVADLSVLALKGNPKKNPALFFYDGFPLTVTTASNIKNIMYEVDVPLGTKGGGGASPDDLANKKRGEFKDTAFWEASVVTDANGRATVSFTLPDNLTTWQIEGLGVTKDTKLGVDYQEFTTKKDLMAIPLKPRFVVPGDSFSLGAQVFNQTGKTTVVNLKLESETLIFKGKKEDSVSIKAGETKTVYFDVVAPSEIRAGSHRFTFTAADDTFIDSVEQLIPITPNRTYETVATANFTAENKAMEYLYVPKEVVSGEGGLTINANATMAVFMTDALSYMVTYPYGCSEQLASSLSTIGTLTEALTLPNVEGEFETIEYDGVTYTVAEVVKNGLKQVYEAQTVGGGFAYYKGLEPDLYLTMHVVTALNNLKEAGYEVRADVIERALSYVEAEAKRVYNIYPANMEETIVLAEYTLRTANGGKGTSLTSIVEKLIENKAFLNEKISSMSLAYFAILTSNGFSQSSKNKVYEALKNRIDIDGRGAYLTAAKTTNYNYYETSIKNTALLLKAFAAHGDENPAMANVLRWLLASRDNSGVWGGTHNTFTVVDAMIDYLDWQHETESNFSLKGLLDGVEIFAHEFTSSNVFKTFTHYIPIDSFTREKLLPLVFEKKNLNDQKNNMYYDMSLKYFLPTESLPPRDEGITIERGLYKLDDAKEENLQTSARVGDVIKGKLTITIPAEYSNVAIEDIVPAGFEIVNFNLDTEDQSLLNDSFGSQSISGQDGLLSRIKNIFGGSQMAQVFNDGGWGGNYRNDTRKLYPTHTETHDDRVFLYVDKLGAGVYEYEYFLRALVPGEFQHLPARAEQLFFPEVFGRTGGDIITVTPAL